MGIVASVADQFWPPKSKFSADDIPDMSGKVVIVTGGNSGSGYETVKELAAKNAKVYMASRSQQRAEEAIRKIEKDTGKIVYFLHLDLSDMDSIRKSAQSFMSQESLLHVLVNNAGLLATPLDQVTSQGYDLQFGTMVLGHYLFTMELLPVLLRVNETTPKMKARVISVSSVNHELVRSLNLAAMKEGPARRALNPQTFYDQSKFGNILFAYELSRHYGSKGIISIALHPGTFHSNILVHYNSFQKWLLNFVKQPTSKGALTQLYAATTPNADSLDGQYLKPWARLSQSSAASRDPAAGKELWDWLKDQTKT